MQVGLLRSTQSDAKGTHVYIKTMLSIAAGRTTIESGSSAQCPTAALRRPSSGEAFKGDSKAASTQAEAIDAGMREDAESSGTDSDEEERYAPAPAEDHEALLFDPDADDEDEDALVQQRHGRHTDALLSCPGCFATLCVECQQHAKIETLYRAMFVQNCRLLDSAGQLQVLCEACETRVGTFDADAEIYEFDTVLASEA